VNFEQQLLLALRDPPPSAEDVALKARRQQQEDLDREADRDLKRQRQEADIRKEQEQSESTKAHNAILEQFAKTNQVLMTMLMAQQGGGEGGKK
jgi:hypothetical protein